VAVDAMHAEKDALDAEFFGVVCKDYSGPQNSDQAIS